MCVYNIESSKNVSCPRLQNEVILLFYKIFETVQIYKLFKNYFINMLKQHQTF